MLARRGNIFLTLALMLVILIGSAGQTGGVAFAAGESENTAEVPLYPGLIWNSLGSSTRNITMNIKGDALSLSGESYQAEERYAEGVAQDVLDYYSNTQLAQSDWYSHDAYQDAQGLHQVFHQEAGFYLIVEFLQCSDDPTSVCVSVWRSEPEKNATFVASETKLSDEVNAGSFGKISPSNGSTGVNPASVTLSWGAYSPTPEKYSYCIEEGSACSDNDPNWTGTYLNRSVTLTNLLPNKTYYWQVKAITCLSCVPKVYYYANGGTWWKFSTALVIPNISGNAGVAGATLVYTDGVTKTVIADGSGNYTLPVTYNWTGVVTPSKLGYVFNPVSKSYSVVKENKTAENYAASVSLQNISGNAGVGGATLTYTDGTVKTVVANSSGDYLITIPNGWSGTVIPSKPGYTFNPVNKSYNNVQATQTAQNYVATEIITFTIRGNVGTGGATLSYVDGTPKTATSDEGGDYVLSVSDGWNGTITPSKTYFSFSPATRSYASNPVTSNLTGQNFTSSKSTFADVPTTYWAWRWVEALYNSGIDGGCGTSPLIYCPSVPVTRAHMAIFLLRGIHGASYMPPAATGLVFGDVPLGSFGAPFIEQLYAEGITGGCGGGNYCPSNSLTRAQMAIFLLRAKHGASYVPPAASGTMFSDVPASHPQAAWIEQLATEGISSGCGGGKFCPGNTVARDQMAVFLVRTFNLPLP